MYSISLCLIVERDFTGYFKQVWSCAKCPQKQSDFVKMITMCYLLEMDFQVQIQESGILKSFLQQVMELLFHLNSSSLMEV